MKVLFVDDEKEILSSIRRQFRKESFEVVTSNSAKEALELLSKEEVQVIVSDERMPVTNGLELLKRVKKKYPNIVRIILSGYADSETIIDAINMGEIYRFVSKPWEYEDIVKVINESIDKWNTEKKNKTYMEQIVQENRELKMRLSFRESCLSLKQEVIDDIPLPLVVIGKDGVVEVFNKYAKDEFLEHLEKDRPITSLFTHNDHHLFTSSTEHEVESSSFDVEILGVKYCIYIRALRPTDLYKGIILFERIQK